MLFINKIKEILKLGIASAFLIDEKPVSILLLADAECGKTSILFSFNYEGIGLCKAITKPTMSIIETMLKEAGEGEIKYMIFPDLVRLTNSSKQTAKSLIGTLNSATDEGLTEITTFKDGVPNTLTLKVPLTIGVATALTRDIMEDRRKGWRRMGFFSRFIPVSYSYNESQQKMIRQKIYEGAIFNNKEIIKLRTRKIKCPKKYPAMFEDYILSLAFKEKLYGFRYARQFRTLLMASALLRGAKKVSMTDVHHLQSLLKYINTDYNETEGGEK
jgi:hypothetical protein